MGRDSIEWFMIYAVLKIETRNVKFICNGCKIDCNAGNFLNINLKLIGRQVVILDSHVWNFWKLISVDNFMEIFYFMDNFMDIIHNSFEN